MRIENQAAFVLHTRDYRDSSLLVELLTAEFGRVSGVVKGVRGTGKAAKQRRGVVQPFVPLLVSWGGKSDLKQIVHFEASGSPLPLVGERLFSAFYVNEVMIRLLQHYDESPDWFLLYQRVVSQLSAELPADIVLRRFELDLLEALGYGIDLSSTADEGREIVAGTRYRFDSGHGFRAVADSADDPAHAVFEGEDLLAMSAGQFSTRVRKSAKRLCRLALAPYLGDKPLKSRELFY